jgi:hypothetical protein
MSNASKVRAVFIGLVFALLALPTTQLFHLPPEWSLMAVLRGLSPALLVLFGQLCIAQGQDRERAASERRPPSTDAHD